MFTRSSLVLFVITLVSFTFGVFFWGYWGLFNGTNQLGLSVYILVLGLLFLSNISLLAFLNESFVASFPIFLACSLPVFITGLNKFSLAAFFLVFLGSFLLNIKAKIFKSSLVKPSIALSLSGLGVVITFFSIALSVVYFPQAKITSKAFQLKIPDQMFTQIYDNLTKQLTQGNSEGGNGVSSAAEKYFDSQIPQIRSQLMSQGITDENQIEEQINRSRVEYLKQVEQSLGNKNAPESGDQASLIKSTVESQLNSVIDANREVLPYILAVSLFFSVTFFTSILTYFILGLVKLYVFLLLKTGVAKIEKLTVESERLTI